jgi:ankyrin repeat protein
MGATALHKAAQSGNADVVELLLDHGAFIDQQSPVLGNTPLIDAVLYKRVDAVRALLERGARTTIRNHWQQSPLELAQADRADEVVALIEARDRADASQVREAVLIAAIKAGNTSEVQRLIDAGASVEERMPFKGTPDDDYTPLGVAAREGHADIVRILLEAGADPRRTTGMYRGTPLHEASYFGHLDVLKAFIELPRRGGGAAIELDAQGAYNGLTPLHDAVWHGHLDAARALVEAGAPLDLRSHWGVTPREMASLYGYDEIVDLLAKAEVE